MKENIKGYVIPNLVLVLLLIVIGYFTIPQLGIDNKKETVEEHKVVNYYKETYQSIYGTYYKYYLVTNDGVFKVSDTEYYESTNTGVYKQWKTSN